MSAPISKLTLLLRLLPEWNSRLSLAASFVVIIKKIKTHKIALAALFLVLPTVAEIKLPPPPVSYVLDEPHVLNQKTLEALQTLFKVHDQRTGEQIVFAIFQTTSGEDSVLWTNRIFQHWK